MKKLLLNVLAIVLIVEEWLWDLLTVTGQYLGQWLRLNHLEYWISQTSANLALLILLVPILLVTPINLTALWLLMNGLLLQGLLLEIVAKLLGTLLIARVFNLTKPQLLSFAWFAWIYHTITTALRWAHAKIVELPIYQLSKRLKAELREKIVSFWL